MKRGRLRLGYPCVNLTLKNSKCTYKILQKTLLSIKDKKEAYQKLLECGKKNLDGLENIIDWNYQNNVHFYRIYSDLFPHISNSKLEQALGKELSIKYRSLQDFKEKIKKIGNKIYQYQIRVSFHPNEFICLGSPTKSVLYSSLADLEWHAKFVDIMETGVNGDSQNSKEFFKDTVFILHGGGQYGDKKETLKRWAQYYQNLPLNIKKRIVLENDERNFNPNDLIDICEENQIPICLDFFHQECYELMHPEEEKCDYQQILPRITKIWEQRNITQKFHYSRQQPEKRLGAHSHYCDMIPKQILDLQDEGKNVDLMLECKAKELALQKTSEIYCERIVKNKIDEKLIKKLNEGAIPVFEELNVSESEKKLIGIKNSLTPLERFNQIKQKNGKTKEKKTKKVKKSALRKLIKKNK